MVAVDTGYSIREAKCQLRPCYLLHWGKSHNIFSCVWIWRGHWRDIKNVENHKMKMISSVGFLQLLVIWLFCAGVFTSPHHRLAAWLTVVKFIFWHLYPHSLHIYENMSARDGENKAESINSRGQRLAPATHQLSRRNQEYFLKNAYNLELRTKVFEIFTITKEALNHGN